MKPSEFWNCTYRELYTFVESNISHQKEEYKKQIILFDALGDKIIKSVASKHPKRVDLVRDNFRSLFEEELKNENKPQSIDEQIRILRSMR